MHFTFDSLIPENQQPLMITVAPFGPQSLPVDQSKDIAVSWKEQVQKAVDCYNAGATVLHFQVPDPNTDHVSRHDAAYGDFIAMLRQAVPNMILQIDGPISLTVKSGKEAKPDQVTVPLGATHLNSRPPNKLDDGRGKQFANPFFEHLKGLRELAIQPYFQMAHVDHLDELEHLISSGAYMGPVNHALTVIGVPGFSGRNPIDFVEYVRRSQPGSVMTVECVGQTVASFSAMAIALGVHVRCGIEDHMRSPKSGLMSSVQQVDQIVRLAKELRRQVATGDEARAMLKLGVWYKSVEETLDALLLPPNRKDGQLGFIGSDRMENSARQQQ